MITAEQRKQLSDILHLFFEDLPEWKYKLMVQRCEQVENMKTVCVPEDIVLEGIE